MSVVNTIMSVIGWLFVMYCFIGFWDAQRHWKQFKAQFDYSKFPKSQHRFINIYAFVVGVFTWPSRWGL